MDRNPFFSLRPGELPIPTHIFMKFDKVDPFDPEVPDETVFSFDGVDTNWVVMQWHDLGGSESSWNAFWSQFWQKQFDPLVPANNKDPRFNTMPLFRVEITPRGDRDLFDLLSSDDAKERWIHIEIGSGKIEADIFTALFGAPIERHIKDLNILDNRQSSQLDAAFSTTNWPIATSNDIREELSRVADPEYLAVYDIGQGSASALLDSGRIPTLFYDLGCGMGRNNPTRPSQIVFDWTRDPIIILSHWDGDHWAAGNVDLRALSRTWIAPKQPSSTTHVTFANDILRAGGRVLIWGQGLALSPLQRHNVSITLDRCRGTDSNGSGLAMLVSNNAIVDGHWLLTGDAGYAQMPFTVPQNLTAIVVPHHGAAMHRRNNGVPGPATSYRRSVYSFGPDNRHGRTSISHPASNTVDDHSAQGWLPGNWLGKPSLCLAQGDILASAINGVGRGANGHLSSMIIGWQQPAPHAAHPMPLVQS